MTPDYLVEASAPSLATAGLAVRGIDWPRVDAYGRPLAGSALRHAEQVRRLAKAVASERDGSLLLVGHSTACSTLLGVALLASPAVAGVVLIGPAWRPVRLPLPLLLRAYSRLGTAMLRLHSREAAFRATYPTATASYYFAHPRPEWIEAFGNAFVSPFWPLLISSKLLKADLRAQLRRQVNQRRQTGRGRGAELPPILLVQGAADRIIPLAHTQQLQAFLASAGAAVQLSAIPDVGHFPMWEDPSRFAAALMSFASAVAQAVPVEHELPRPGPTA